MAAEATDDEPRTPVRIHGQAEKGASNGHEDSVDHDDDEEEDDDDDDDQEQDDVEDEPKLKYSRLTSSLLSTYRNGDATSTFTVAGDKMVLS